MLKNLGYNWKTKFGKDVAITILGQIVVLVVAFGINKVLSIKLGVIGFGEFSIVKRTAGVISFVMLAGMGIAIPKYLAIFRQLDDRTKEARFVISGLLIMTSLTSITMIVLFIFRTSFSTILFGEKGYVDYILPILLYALALTLSSFAYSYYRGLDKFYIFNFSQISIQLITLILVFIYGGNIIELLYSWSLAIGIFGIYIYIKAWQTYYHKAKIKSFKNDLKTSTVELLQFSIPRILGEFVLFSYTVVPLIIINHKLGMEVAGYFAVATSINVMINPLFSFIGLILLPFVSKSIASNKFSEAVQKVNMLAKIYLFIGILGIAFVELFTPFVINILFSSDYQPSVPIVRILILAVLPNAFYLLLRNPLDAGSKVPYNTINLLNSFIILNVLIIFSTNTYHIAVSFVIAYLTLCIMSLLAWQKCKRELLTKGTSILND